MVPKLSILLVLAFSISSKCFHRCSNTDLSETVLARPKSTPKLCNSRNKKTVIFIFIFHGSHRQGRTIDRKSAFTFSAKSYILIENVFFRNLRNLMSSFTYEHYDSVPCNFACSQVYYFVNTILIIKRIWALFLLY